MAFVAYIYRALENRSLSRSPNLVGHCQSSKDKRHNPDNTSHHSLLLSTYKFQIRILFRQQFSYIRNCDYTKYPGGLVCTGGNDLLPIGREDRAPKSISVALQDSQQLPASRVPHSCGMVP